MSLLHFKGFDDEALTFTGGAQLLTGGRGAGAGGGRLRWTSPTTSVYQFALPNLASGNLTRIMGCAAYIGASTSYGQSIIGIAHTTPGSIAAFVTGNSGDVHCYVDGGLDLGGIGLAANTWHWLEIRAYWSASVFRVIEFWANDVLVDSHTGLVGYPTGAGLTADLYPYNIDGSPTLCDISLDDFWVLDGTGTLNNASLGDQAITLLRPTGDYGTLLLRSDTSADSWEHVNDVPHDSDATYLYKLGGNFVHASTFHMDDVGGGALSTDIVPGVNAIGWFRFVAAFGSTGAYLVVADTTPGTTVLTNTGQLVTNAAYTRRQLMYEACPNQAAGTAWTVGQLDVTALGASCANNTTGNEMRITALCFEIMQPYTAPPPPDPTGLRQWAMIVG